MGEELGRRVLNASDERGPHVNRISVLVKVSSTFVVISKYMPGHALALVVLFDAPFHNKWRQYC